MTSLLRKATAAARAAHILAEAGLFEDAVNRAYYAMFDSARAFLLHHVGAEAADMRRHASVIARFSKEAVLTGLVAQEHGRALARAFDDRLLADYTERAMDAEEARILVGKMDAFIAAVRTTLKTEDEA